MGRERLVQANLAFIGGTGLEELLREGRELKIGTPFGPSPKITLGKIGSLNVAFLPRHGEEHDVPPHRVNYRGNIWSLNKLGVTRIIATNAVGAVNEEYKPGDFVVPRDIIDFTKMRSQTFYDEAPVTHIDVTNPYCPELVSFLLRASRKHTKRVRKNAIFACMEGPRYETPAEIRMLRKLGADIVGMTAAPETFLARELEMCYATICFVSNMAAGIQARLTTEEVIKVAGNVMPKLKLILKEVAGTIPRERRCVCSRALQGAKI